VIIIGDVFSMGCSVHPSARPHRSSDAKHELDTRCKEQDTVPFRRLADDPCPFPLLKGYDRPSCRLHCHHPEVVRPIFTRFRRLDKAEPFAGIAATTGVPIRTYDNRKEAPKPVLCGGQITSLPGVGGHLRTLKSKNWQGTFERTSSPSTYS
jgi:hypothetical protein